MALTSKVNASASSNKVDAHSHADLEKQLSKVQQDLVALTQKCASLEARLASKPAPVATPSGDFVQNRDWQIWKRKVAKKIGLRL